MSNADEADLLGDVITAGVSSATESAIPTDVVTPLTLSDIWINTVGWAVDWIPNSFSELLGWGLMIGNGADGTAAHLDGFAGGWLLGDGGNGFDGGDAGVSGGAGGAAGMIGDGGSGGDGSFGTPGGDGGNGGWLLGSGGHGGNGGDGAFGGDGGDGGNGLGLFGVGGDGGNGGNGGDSGVGGNLIGDHPLPALGGAGGLAGLWGTHGDVGHYGGGVTVPVNSLTPVNGFDSQLTVTGPWITNSAGQVVIMHGVNEVYKIPPYDPAGGGFNDADATYLASIGVTEVRVGLLWEGVEPQPGVIDYNYLNSIEQTVQTLAKHHIHSLLDMHQDLYTDTINTEGDGAPAWATDTGGLQVVNAGFPWTYALSPAENHAWDTLWSNSSTPGSDGLKLENAYANMWQSVAAYFNGNPNVAGYEIMNEPWPGSKWLDTILGGSSFDAQTLTPFYNQVDAAIRSVDPTTTVYFEPSTLTGNLPVATHLGEVHDPNTVYSFHDYCLSTSIFGGSSFGCGLWEDLIQGDAARYASTHNIPAEITEFGNTTSVPSITDTLNTAGKNDFGWLFWDYSPLVVNSLGDPSAVGNLNTSVADALNQPYPEIISGTPGVFTVTDGALHFSYSTDMASGAGSFGAGTQTTIWVPSDAYTAVVTGGTVVSEPGAHELVIAANGTSDTVNVTVTPNTVP